LKGGSSKGGGGGRRRRSPSSERAQRDPVTAGGGKVILARRRKSPTLILFEKEGEKRSGEESRQGRGGEGQENASVVSRPWREGTAGSPEPKGGGGKKRSPRSGEEKRVAPNQTRKKTELARRKKNERTKGGGGGYFARGPTRKTGKAVHVQGKKTPVRSEDSLPCSVREKRGRVKKREKREGSKAEEAVVVVEKEVNVRGGSSSWPSGGKKALGEGEVEGRW